jgi:hypothetical protein
MGQGGHSCRGIKGASRGTFVQNVRNSLKMDEVKLSMFNRAYHTFLSNQVKINKKLHASFEIMEL